MYAKKERSRVCKLLGYTGMYDLFVASFTYVLSMVCTNYALTHVSYPSQVLLKSAKMVPVVIGGFLLFNKRYPWYDYFAVVGITSALVGFNLGKANMPTSTSTSSILGLVLLCISLLCDGFTGPRQDRVVYKYKLGSIHLMFFANFFSLIWLSIGYILFEDGYSPILYCIKYPYICLYICVFCISACIGQIFIFSTLSNIGSLYLTIITTTRKFFTVLVSVCYFKHKLTYIQWLCVLCIFACLALQSVFKHSRKTTKSTTITGEVCTATLGVNSAVHEKTALEDTGTELRRTSSMEYTQSPGIYRRPRCTDTYTACTCHEVHTKLHAVGA